MTKNSHTIKIGDYFPTNCIAKFKDGTVFDTTSKGKALEAGIADKEKKYGPLFFTVDTGQVIMGTDKVVLEMAHSGPAKRNCKEELQSR